jgi:hypothetical protein
MDTLLVLLKISPPLNGSIHVGRRRKIGLLQNQEDAVENGRDTIDRLPTNIESLSIHLIVPWRM